MHPSVVTLSPTPSVIVTALTPPWSQEKEEQGLSPRHRALLTCLVSHAHTDQKEHLTGDREGEQQPLGVWEHTGDTNVETALGEVTHLMHWGRRGAGLGWKVGNRPKKGSWCLSNPSCDPEGSLCNSGITETWD